VRLGCGRTRGDGADKSNHENEPCETQEGEQHDLREGDGLAVLEHEDNHGENRKTEDGTLHEEDAGEHVAPRSLLPEEGRRESERWDDHAEVQ